MCDSRHDVAVDVVSPSPSTCPVSVQSPSIYSQVKDPNNTSSATVTFEPDSLLSVVAQITEKDEHSRNTTTPRKERNATNADLNFVINPCQSESKCVSDAANLLDVNSEKYYYELLTVSQTNLNSPSLKIKSKQLEFETHRRTSNKKCEEWLKGVHDSREFNSNDIETRGIDCHGDIERVIHLSGNGNKSIDILGLELSLNKLKQHSNTDSNQTFETSKYSNCFEAQIPAKNNAYINFGAANGSDFVHPVGDSETNKIKMGNKETTLKTPHEEESPDDGSTKCCKVPKKKMKEKSKRVSRCSRSDDLAFDADEVYPFERRSAIDNDLTGSVELEPFDIIETDDIIV